MPAHAARSLRRRPAFALMLLAPLGVVAPTWAAPAWTAPGQAPDAVLHILVPPPTKWDHQMLATHPALNQTVSNFKAITGGIAFGMPPAGVNAKLPVPEPGIAWTSLPQATEFQDDVRYFWTRLDGVHELRAGATACAGAGSYIVFLFQQRGLFRVSYRLTPDAACPNVAAAADEIFGRYVGIAQDIAQSVHYRVGTMEVVDITDPTAGELVGVRWQPRAD